MSTTEELHHRIAALEAEVGEAVAAQALAEEHLREAEAALHAAYDLLAGVADPVFAPTLEVSRQEEALRLRRRIRRLRARNERLTGELARLRGSRAVRWSAAVRRVRARLLRGSGR